MLLAQWRERQPPKLKVSGSIPLEYGAEALPLQRCLAAVTSLTAGSRTSSIGSLNGSHFGASPRRSHFGNEGDESSPRRGHSNVVSHLSHFENEGEKVFPHRSNESVVSCPSHFGNEGDESSPRRGHCILLGF